MAHRMNKDYGHLGGHYNQLQHEDRNIHRQEQREARANGGWISRKQQGQLNREENSLKQQIKQDYQK